MDGEREEGAGGGTAREEDKGEEPKNSKNCPKLLEAGKGKLGYPWSSEKAWSCQLLGLGRWYPKLWQSISATDHSLVPKYFAWQP